jgi:hypothetical protein
MADPCIVPECKRPQKTRGLCGPCRQQAGNAIRRGETTDNELVAAGLMLPHKAKVRPRVSLFYQAFLAAKADDTPTSREDAAQP